MATRKFTMVACIICLLDRNIWSDAETFIEYFESIARAGLLCGITVLAKGRRAVDEGHQMVHHGDKYSPQPYLDFQVL